MLLVRALRVLALRALAFLDLAFPALALLVRALRALALLVHAPLVHVLLVHVRLALRETSEIKLPLDSTISAHQVFWLGEETQQSLHGRSPRSPSSILCPLLQSPPGGQTRPFSLRLSALVKSRRGSPTPSDVVA